MIQLEAIPPETPTTCDGCGAQATNRLRLGSKRIHLCRVCLDQVTRLVARHWLLGPEGLDSIHRIV